MSLISGIHRVGRENRLSGELSSDVCDARTGIYTFFKEWKTMDMPQWKKKMKNSLWETGSRERSVCDFCCCFAFPQGRWLWTCYVAGDDLVHLILRLLLQEGFRPAASPIHAMFSIQILQNYLTLQPGPFVNLIRIKIKVNVNNTITQDRPRHGWCRS